MIGFRNLTRVVKTIRVINATAAGTTAINGTVVDMQGFETVRGVVCLGALTATQTTSVKLQAGDLANGSDMADITGAVTANAADGDGNKMLIVEAYRPKKRYVRLVVTRGVANAVVDSGVMELTLPAEAPVTADATVSQQTIIGA